MISALIPLIQSGISLLGGALNKQPRPQQRQSFMGQTGANGISVDPRDILGGNLGMMGSLMSGLTDSLSHPHEFGSGTNVQNPTPFHMPGTPFTAGLSGQDSNPSNGGSSGGWGMNFPMPGPTQLDPQTMRERNMRPAGILPQVGHSKLNGTAMRSPRPLSGGNGGSDHHQALNVFKMLGLTNG